MKKIGIILLDWNGIDVTRECLHSLTLLKTSSDFVFDIILIDNGSVVPSKEQFENDFKDVIYYRLDNNLGFSAGNNIGLKYLLQKNYDYSLLLNNDTTVNEDFLQILFKEIENDEKVGVVQPRIHFYHDTNIIWNAGTRYFEPFTLPVTIGYNSLFSAKYSIKKTIPWATGCCMLIRNSMFTQNELGLLNEQYETYFEDVDFSFRVRKLGYKIIYCPDSLIFHRAGYSVNSSEDKAEGKTHPFIVFMHSRNKILFSRTYFKWYFLPSIIISHLIYYLLLMLRFLFLSRTKKLKSTISGIFEGVTKKIRPVPLFKFNRSIYD